MKNRPTIQLYSNDAPRRRGSGKPGVIVGLGLPVVFGAAVYAGTERGATGSWAPLALSLVVLPVAVVALFSASFVLWVRRRTALPRGR